MDFDKFENGKQEYPMVVPKSTHGELHPQYVLSELNKIAKDDAIIVTDEANIKCGLLSS